MEDIMKWIDNNIPQLRVPVLIAIALVSILHHSSVSAKVAMSDVIKDLEDMRDENVFEQDIIPDVEHTLLHIEEHLHNDEEYIDTDILEDNRIHV